MKEADEARADYNVDGAVGDAVAIVRMFLADRFGMALGDEEVLDRVDNAVRQLLAARGPVDSADLVTVLACFIAMLLGRNTGPHGDPQALFDSLVRAQVDLVRQRRVTDRSHSRGTY